MKQCPKCGFTMQDADIFCQNCGAKDIYATVPTYNPPVKKKMNPVLIALLVVLGIAVAGALGFLSYQLFIKNPVIPGLGKNASTEEETIVAEETKPAETEETKPEETKASEPAVTEEPESAEKESEESSESEIPDPVVIVEEGAAAEVEAAAEEMPAAETASAQPAKADHVEYNHITENGKESAVITGRAQDGSEVWNYVTNTYDMAQLDRVQEVGICGDKYIYAEDGSIRAFEYETGKKAWANSKYNGAVTGYQIDSDGKLYMCGYLGPDLMVIDTKDGTTIKKIDNIASGYVRASAISLDGDDIVIEYEEGGTLRVNKQTYEPEGIAKETYSKISMSDVVNATASTWLNEPEFGLQHTAWCVLDNRTDLAWTEDNPNNGVGEYVELFFNEKHMVSGFNIWAGHHVSADLYGKNSRPKTLKVSLDDGSSMEVTLNDEMKMQTVQFDEPVATSSIRFTVVSVYEGWKYSDVCISEIQLY